MWVRKDKSEKNDKSDKSAVEHASGAAPGDHNKQQSGNLSRVSLSLSDPVREAAQGQSERPLSQSDPASHAAGAAASPQPSHASVGPRLYSRVERKASFTRSLEVFVTGENIAKGRIEKTLLAIVMDEGRCEQFHRFLESRYMEEGLMCLLEILEFEMQPSVHRGKRLYDQYLASGAEKEVTVSHTDVENIRAQILAQKVPDFIAVKCEILTTLSMVMADFTEAAAVPTVESCFRDERLFGRLLAFGKTCEAESRLLLLKALVRYDQLQNAAERESMGRELVKLYFGKGGVEVSAAASKTIETANRDGSFSASTFDLAKADLHRFFVFDLYPRFLADDNPLSSASSGSSSAGVAAVTRVQAMGKNSVSSPEMRRTGLKSSGDLKKAGNDNNALSPSDSRRSGKHSAAGSANASKSASPDAGRRSGVSSRNTSPSSLSPAQSPLTSPRKGFLGLFRRKSRATRPELVTPRNITRSQRRDSYTRSLEDFLFGSSGGSVHKTLLAIINAEDRCELFRKFLEARFMDEGLTCLLSVLEFELVPTAENGRLIYERYIASDAPDEITLEAPIIAKLKRAVDAGEVPNFDEVKCVVLTSLSLVLADFMETCKMPTVEETLLDARLLPFARTCYSEEAVLFLRATTEFESLATEKERESAGRDIVKFYLTKGGIHEINLSDRVMKMVDEEVRKGLWAANTFKAARNEQMKLFVFDIYPRFLQHCNY